VLGCFARYVTIYAQQVRALNLIDCLAKSGVLSARSKLAVVGGGLAGLTAASAAVRRGVTDVVVFEKESQLLRLQASSLQRYIHPHTYDWPAAGALEDDAGLPVMNWRAGLAQLVVADLLKDWQKEFGGVIKVSPLPCLDISIRNGADGPEIVRST